MFIIKQKTKNITTNRVTDESWYGCILSYAHRDIESRSDETRNIHRNVFQSNRHQLNSIHSSSNIKNRKNNQLNHLDNDEYDEIDKYDEYRL